MHVGCRRISAVEWFLRGPITVSRGLRYPAGLSSQIRCRTTVYD